MKMKEQNQWEIQILLNVSRMTSNQILHLINKIEDNTKVY